MTNIPFRNDNPLPSAATFSKDVRTWAHDFYPTELEYGKGAHVWDKDGRSWLDWVSGLGANLLGYCNSDFCQRVEPQIWRGAGFSLPHTFERQVALKLVNLLGSHVPGWRPDTLQVRFGKSGTDATTMAIRLARAVTGHYRILKCYGHYHGWADWSTSTTPPAWGVIPEERTYVTEWKFNDTDSLWTAYHSQPELPVAAIIMEQPLEEPYPDFYPEVRRFCDETKTLLILDEVVTFLRYGLGGASGMFEIEPDLICVGKALGNGFPISALIGRKEYMTWFDRVDPVFCSSTHFGDAVSLAAADAVLTIFGRKDLVKLWATGHNLIKGLQDSGWHTLGIPPRSIMNFKSLGERLYFVLGMRDHGILMNRPNFPNLGHTAEDVERTTWAAKEVRQHFLENWHEDDPVCQQWVEQNRPWILFQGR